MNEKEKMEKDEVESSSDGSNMEGDAMSQETGRAISEVERLLTRDEAAKDVLVEKRVRGEGVMRDIDGIGG